MEQPSFVTNCVRINIGGGAFVSVAETEDRDTVEISLGDVHTRAALHLSAEQFDALADAKYRLQVKRPEKPEGPKA